MKKKPPTRKPARAKAKRTAMDRARMTVKVLEKLLERSDTRIADLTAKLNTANACVAKQIERIGALAREVGTTYDRLQEAHRERDEKQCTINRLCIANEAMAGELEALKAAPAGAAPLKVGDVLRTDDEKRRVPVGARVMYAGAEQTVQFAYPHHSGDSVHDHDYCLSRGYDGDSGDWTITHLPPAPQAEQPAKPRTGVVVDVEKGDTWTQNSDAYVYQYRDRRWRGHGPEDTSIDVWHGDAARGSSERDITPAEARAQIEAWGHKWREQPAPRTRTLWAAEYAGGCVWLYATEKAAREAKQPGTTFYPLTFTEPSP